MSRHPEEAAPAEIPELASGPGPARAPGPACPDWDWSDLNRSFRPRLIAAGIVRFGLSHDECEDAAQDVFLAILTQRTRIRDPHAYLRVAFLHRCQELLERRGARAETDLEHATDPADDPRGRVETTVAVTGAYHRVGEKCREVIRNYCLEERTLAETARRSGYSSKTVWKRLQECLKRMRQCLAP